jgi:hypothetical protein
VAKPQYDGYYSEQLIINNYGRKVIMSTYVPSLVVCGMQIIFNKPVSSRIIGDTDYHVIFDVYRNQNINHLWSPDTIIDDFDYFSEKLSRRLKHRWNHARLFEKTGGITSIGFGYCYQANENNKFGTKL